MAFTEELLLPSRGIIYCNPDFNGVVNVKPFTTKAYKDLLTGNASEAALKQFVDTCLVDCPIKAKNMNQNDVLAILLKTRVMTLGNLLKQEIKCPDCDKSNELKWDLNATDINYLCVEKYPIPVTLPHSGKEIKIRFPTGADSIKAKQAADRRAATFKKQASDFMHIFSIVSVIDIDGKDIVEKADWYESLSPQDAIYIDEVLAEMADTFGVKLTREEHCPVCDKVFTAYIDIWSDFFRPYEKVGLGITSKAGNLAGYVEKSDISE